MTGNNGRRVGRGKRQYVTTEEGDGEITIPELYRKLESFITKTNQKLDSIKSDLKNLATKEEVNQVREEVAEMQERHNAEMEAMRATMERMEERIVRTEARVINNENHNRRLNLVFQNVPEQLGQCRCQGTCQCEENTVDVLRHMMVNKMQLSENYVRSIYFRDVHRLGPRGSRGTRTRTGPLPIIAAFILQEDRNYVLKNASSLSETNISIRSDLTRETAIVRDKMVLERKNLRNRGITARVIERSYMPVIQTKASGKWLNYTMPAVVEGYTPRGQNRENE